MVEEHNHKWVKTKNMNNYERGEYYEYTCYYRGCKRVKRLYYGRNRWVYYNRKVK